MNDRFKFIKNTELKNVGKSKKQRYMFALFECPYCHKLIETRKTVGMKQVCCKECYKKYRKGKHFGAIPKGSKVIFLDRNKMNFDIENLALVTSAELARLNQNHRISEFQEVTKAGIALEKYKEAIRQSRRNK